MQHTLPQLKHRLEPLENPYLRALRNGTFEKADFVETQIQFLSAVVWFPRPMLALAARLPRAQQRALLLENVRDEHGDGHLGRAHEQTFLAFLSLFGVDARQIDRRAQWPEVRAFNLALQAVATHDDLPSALAVFGIIEDLFAGISTQIGRAIVARGWVTEEALVHYPTREVPAPGRAQGFYDLVEPLADADARAGYEAVQGLELGAHLFLRLYEDLYRARKRRAWRELGGPHSLADGWSVPAERAPADGGT